MSSNSTVPLTSAFPSGLALLGGIPTQSQDLVASGIFLLAYIVLSPIVIFRLVKRSTRCWALIRPAAFVQARIATFFIRVVMSKGNYASGWFIAEQITLLSGFVLICEPALTILRAHVEQSGSGERILTDKDRLISKVLRLLQVALIIALGLGVYTGTKFGDLNDSKTLSQVENYRDANALICLGVTIVIGIVAMVVQVSDSLELRNTAWIVVLAALLTIPSAYKLILYKSSPPNPVGAINKALFYILASIPEFLVAGMYLSTNLIEKFGVSPIGSRGNSDRQERLEMGNQQWKPMLSTSRA